MSQCHSKSHATHPISASGADLCSTIAPQGSDLDPDMQDLAGNAYLLDTLPRETSAGVGTAGTATSPASAAPPKGRSWFGDAWDAVESGVSTVGGALHDGGAWVGDRVGDALDIRENEAEKDAAEDPKPITRDATQDEWDKLHSEVAAFEAEDDTVLKKATSDEEALAAGKTLTATEKRPDGMIEEMSVGVIKVPWDQFITKVFPSDWGKKLYGYAGGEVKEIEKDDQGRSVRQEERMVLETPMSQYLSWVGIPAVKDLDMTKTEAIENGEDNAKVRWRVYTSDNDTVSQDIGYVNFESVGNGVKVTFHSAHKYTDSYNAPFNQGPMTKVADYLTANGLQDYFKNAIDHYRELAGE